MLQGIPSLIDSFFADDQKFFHYASMKRELPLALIQFGLHHTGPGYAYGPAIRNHDLIHFVFAGKGELQLGEHVYPVTDGQMFLIPSSQISFYQADPEEPWVYAWVGYTGEWGRELLHMTGIDLAHPIAKMRDSGKIQTIVENMMRVAQEPNAYVALMGMFYQILYEVSTYRPLSASEATFASTGRRVTADKYVDTIISSIHKNFSHPFSVEDLAASIGFTRPYLTKIFKQTTGMSIQDYLTDQRMSYAMLQLKATDKPISQIAEECGLPDQQYFARMFKKTYGMTPTAYREQSFRSAEDASHE